MRLKLGLIAGLIGCGLSASGAAILIPPGSFINGADTTGLTLTGTFSASDTLNITISNVISGGLPGPCLQNSPAIAYCTNAAGVIVVAGNGGGVGAVGLANVIPSTNFFQGFDYGAVVVSVFNSTTVLNASTLIGQAQLFAANAGNGLGSGAPPQSLSYTGTLGGIGGSLGSVSGVTGTIAFTVADEAAKYTDNSGAFSASTVPEPSTMLLLGSALAGLGFIRRRRKLN